MNVKTAQMRPSMNNSEISTAQKSQFIKIASPSSSLLMQSQTQDQRNILSQRDHQHSR